MVLSGRKVLCWPGFEETLPEYHECKFSNVSEVSMIPGSLFIKVRELIKVQALMEPDLVLIQPCGSAPFGINASFIIYFMGPKYDLHEE